MSYTTLKFIIAYHRCSRKKLQPVAAAADGADCILVPRPLVARTYTTALLCTCTVQPAVRTLAVGTAAATVAVVLVPA